MTKDEFAQHAGLAIATAADCHNVTGCLRRSACTCARRGRAVADYVWPMVEALIEAAKGPPPIPPGTMIEETMPNGLKAWTMK